MKDTFVDTWGWCTLADEDEPQHEITAIIVEELADTKRRLITTNFILDETYTLIRMRIHHHAAVEFHYLFNAMVDDQVVTLIHGTPEIEQSAWEIFERYDDKDFSFTDCASFVVMQQLHIILALTDDHHYEQMGFNILP